MSNETKTTGEKSMEALLQESKQFRANAMEAETINSLLRANERKKQAILENKEISAETRKIELAYVERLRGYWLEHQAKQA